jgi:hypothetical protein
MLKTKLFLGFIAVVLLSLSTCLNAEGPSMDDVALASEPSFSGPSSYFEVSRRLKFNTTADLIERKGISIFELIGGLTGLGKKFRGRLRDTTTEPSDFKSAENKLLHSRGVCSEASWKITQDTGATGLFEAGTEIPAIVRFSGGTDASVYQEGETRIFGIAVKLFPTQNKKQKIASANIFLMSQGGLEGDARQGFFSKPDGEVVFSNVIAEPKGFALKMLGKLFKLFDPIVISRPLFPAAIMNQYSEPIADPKTPFQINVRAQDFGHQGKGGGDFRSEIMGYGANQMQFDLSLVMSRDSDEELQAGVLTLEQPFMSDVCDQELHFHHHKNR